METIIAQYRSLFLRYIDDISAIYRTYKRCVATIVRWDIGASLRYLVDISFLRYIAAVIYRSCDLLHTYWDLHTEKPQSEFSFANRCKPIKCRVSLFPHVRQAIRPIGSRVSCFFTCDPYGKLKPVFIQGWLARFRTPHKPSNKVPFL